MNLQVPLPDRSPANRASVGLQVEWLTKAHPPLRCELDRDRDTITCSTKGNYALAFPSRPFQQRVRTVIFYPSQQRSVLRYSYTREHREEIFQA
jgi:hypothetical protein